LKKTYLLNPITLKVRQNQKLVLIIVENIYELFMDHQEIVHELIEEGIQNRLNYF